MYVKLTNFEVQTLGRLMKKIHKYSVFNSNDQISEPEDRDWMSSDFLPYAVTKIVQKQLYQLNIHMSMGPDTGY